MKILFILKNGTGTITWEVPEPAQAAFNFVGVCRGVRCDGFFQAEALHIRYEEVAIMLFDDGSNVANNSTFREKMN